MLYQQMEIFAYWQKIESLGMGYLQEEPEEAKQNGIFALRFEFESYVDGSA